MQKHINNRITHLFLAIATLLIHFSLSLSARSKALDLKLGESIDIHGAETSYNHDTGIATAKGDAHISCGNTQLYAEQAEYHVSSGDVYIEGNVSIYQGELVHKGDAAIYNINTGEIQADELRSGLAPMFYKTGNLESEIQELDKISMHSSIITTHDSANPNYQIKAKEVKIVGLNGPKEKRRIIFNNMTVYAGKVPVFWLPYLSQPLDAEQSYQFLPGYKNSWGTFLLNKYGMMIGDKALATYHLDFRSSRGIAGGLDLKSQMHKNNENFGQFKSYYANDQDTSLTHNNRKRDESIEPDRYRVNLQHRIEFDNQEDLKFYLDIDINKTSDQYFYEDFFPEEFRLDPQPDNILNLQKIFPNAVASLWSRFQANEFYQTDTRLPELALDLVTRPIGKTGIFYSGEISGGIYEQRLSTKERKEILQGKGISHNLLNEPENLFESLRSRNKYDSEFTRIDTYHQLSMPQQLFGWLNVTPRTGIRGTSYSRINGTDQNDTRKAIHAGLDASFKLTRDYNDLGLSRLGLTKLRHTVEPFMHYSFVAADELNSDIGKIDHLVSSTKLRPIDLSEFTATDEINDWSIIRSGISQQFLTYRNGKAHNWMTLKSYMEHYIDDPEFDRDFSNLYNEITFTPLPWFSISHEIGIPLFTEDPFDYTESNTRITLMPTDQLEFSIAHRFLQDHPILEDSDLLDFRTYYRIGDRWGLSARQRYEFDDGTLEFQQYSLHYDLNSWTAGIGALIADHRSTEDEFGLVFTLTLKDFPSLSVPVGITPSH
ncbi:hypothetical protein OAL09_05055 [Verrucomicrobia bacterium]|nr:hypothetical protein [Verrucomicrobiota bacterium]NCG27668.1 hypothetical protein [Verrucomicrobiales bacterium]